jgi:hypothetical protein
MAKMIDKILFILFVSCDLVAKIQNNDGKEYDMFWFFSYFVVSLHHESERPTNCRIALWGSRQLCSAV